jgi:chromosome segregation protein
LVYLKKIETRGFKSMGSKLISTPVEKGLVAITGPNGSGKSNLLDAILFALGENSAKTLRAANLQALIYDGSVEEQKPSSARVSLQFDNSDRRIPLDSDSVTITRELKQTGESIYSLNGKHVQRNNLSELLEVALIASRGLNIVLQGMITRISELVPDEKRKLIEQMVGIAQFDEKKQQAMTQLKDADAKLAVAMAKIEEIRDRVQLLEEQRNGHLRLKQLEDQIRWLRAASASTKLMTIRNIISQKRDQYNSLNSRLTQLQSRFAEVSQTVGQLESERSVLIKSAMETGTAKIEVELGNVSTELSALKKERTEAKEYLDKMRQVSPYLARMLEEQKDKITQAESEIGSLAAKLGEIENKKRELEDNQKELSAERMIFESELDAARQEIGAIRKEKEVEDAKLQSSKDTLSGLINERRAAEDRLASVREKIKFYDSSLAEVTKSIEQISGILTSQRNELGQIQNERMRFEHLRGKLEQQLDAAALILQKTQNAVTKYDSDLAAIENVAAEEIALKRLESNGDTEAIKGYLGPLGALISYDAKYSQAIAALGREWLNAVVVDNVESLIKVAETARRLKISRLTTIPMSELGTFRKRISTPDLKGMLSPVSSVINCHKGIRKIVNFVFGDAVIVDSPRNAFVAAKRGFRAVTLQGDVFEPEIFAFETGYSKRYAIVNEILGKQQGFEGIKNTLGSFRAVISKRREALSKLQEQSQKFTQAEQDRNIDLSKLETKLDSSKEYLSKYAEHSEALKVKERSMTEDISRIESNLDEAKKSYEAQALLCDSLAKKISSMDLSSFEERNSALTKKKSDLDSRFDLVMSEMRDITTEITRVRGDLENNRKPGLERLNQQITENQNSELEKTKFLSDTETKYSELDARYRDLKTQEESALEKANRFQPKLDAIDQKLALLKSEEETLRKQISASEREQISSNLDLDRLSESERNVLGQLGLFGYAEPIEAFDGAETLLKELNAEFDSLRNNVNLLADRNYREVFENYKYSSVRKNELEKERNAIVMFIETIDSEKRKVFMEAFERIDRELRMIFSKVTNGNAWLEVENPDSIFDSGVFLQTQFPGKMPRDSSSVSGGEKTVSALSFILAIQAVFPSPFYVFDEVDAHLDSNYSGKIAEILAERSSFSQIIIVSLKDTVVSKANSVIGVYMSQGSSKIIRYRTGMEVEIRAEQ